MDQIMSQTGRMMQATFDWWQLGWQVAETMFAAQTVIGRRMTMMGQGFNRTGRMPYAEMSRFVPEKTAAFSKANTGALRAMTAGEVGPLPVAAMDTAVSGTLTMLDLSERMLAASTAWWTPLHAKATSNARRLRKR